ncbi:MAG: ribosomal protein S18-alanine N-acetyltransferase [Acidobacteriota bacterium]
MSAELVIRPMTAADLGSVMQMATALANVPRWSERSWQEAIKPPHIALVAADAAGLSAFAIATVAAGEAELQTLAVSAGQQRRGIARQLLSVVLAELRRASVAELWLEVRLSNAPAIALYRAFGFQETGRRRGYYSDPVEDALLMLLPLR